MSATICQHCAFLLSGWLIFHLEDSYNCLCAGHSKSVSGAASNKRWKSNYHLNKSKEEASTAAGAAKEQAGGAPPPPPGQSSKSSKGKSKFLLGGNIRDPLNLNSLSDERVNRMLNAVTPESSPMPTPKHRKPEYKIEVRGTSFDRFLGREISSIMNLHELLRDASNKPL